MNVAYYYCAEYNDNTIFLTYQVFLIIRPVIIGLLLVYYLPILVRHYEDADQNFMNKLGNTAINV